MATYYVRTPANGGSDSNDGSTPALAFATIDKAANTVTSAAHTIWVGSGVYRELVTMDTSGTSGNLIEYKADVTGEQTGDAGLVIISAYADETSTASRAGCVNLNGKQFITWDGFVMTGGTEAALYDNSLAGARAYEDVSITSCVIVGGHADQDNAVDLDLNAGANPTGVGITFDKCVFSGGVLTRFDVNASASVDTDITWTNCLFYGSATSGGYYGPLSFLHIGGSGSFSPIGFEVRNCTFVGKFIAIYADTEMASGGVSVYNNLFHGCRTAMQNQTAAGSITSDYNVIVACENPHSSVTAGGNDKSNDRDPGLLGGLADLVLYQKIGWSPFKPWEPIRLQDDSYSYGVIGVASASYAPADDFYGSPRPMYGTADDVGAVEGRARPEKETTTKRTGSNAIHFNGPGYHDILIPVNAAETTVSVYVQHTSSPAYGGTNYPQLIIYNIPGVADQTDTATSTQDSFQELTLTFTPTSAGVCRARLLSRNTSATAACFFDDLTVT